MIVSGYSGTSVPVGVNGNEQGIYMSYSTPLLQYFTFRTRISCPPNSDVSRMSLLPGVVASIMTDLVLCCSPALVMSLGVSFPSATFCALATSEDGSVSTAQGVRVRSLTSFTFEIVVTTLVGAAQDGRTVSFVVF